jgi:hypothetical protein
MKKNKNCRLATTLFMLIVMLVWSAAAAQAQTLVANDDRYGVPYDQALEVEAFGVLDNDTLDGQNAGENGVTVETVPVSDVNHGTLVLNSDGSFSYTPGTSFTGSDSFIYRAVSGMVTGDATVTLTACTGGPTAFTCWKEAPYLAKLGELGYVTFQEGFEDDAAWGAVREPNTALSVVSQGVAWQTNHPDPPASNGITTGTGPAHTGLWGVYDPEHGYATGTPTQCDIDIPPPQCLFKDGFTGTRQPGASTLYGVGGYFTGSLGPNLVMILDGGAPIGLGLVPVGDPTFFGVIDTTGFTTFRVEETDGKVGQIRLVFADDFTFGVNPSIFYISALNGNDQSGDGSISDPWQTINYALSQIVANAAPITIRVTDDTYPENVLADENGALINLIGGCNESFLTCITQTAIKGSLDIADATIVVENIVLEP